MTEQDPIQPPGSPGGSTSSSGAAAAQPPSPPPNQPSPPAYARGTGRPVSFWVALVFGLLLLGSGMLNLFFFVLFLFGSAAGEAFDGSGMQDLRTLEAPVDGESSLRKKVAIIDIEGVIGPSEASFFGGPSEDMVARVRRYLDRAADDPDVVGVVLYVDSPGGTVTDSDQLYRLAREFRDEAQKPLAAYFHSVAASGGYYAGMAAERVFMHPTGITGSIGVILGTWNYSEAAEKLGIRRVTILSDKTPYKDILSGDRPVRQDEIAILKSLVEEMYQAFVDVVDAGRSDLDRAAVIEVADGRIYSARQAKDAKLVDEVAFLEDAVRWVAERAGEGPARSVRYEPRPGLLETLMGAKAPKNPIAERFGLLDPSPKLMYLWTGAR